MSGTSVRRLVLCTFALVATLGGAGCAKRSDALGAGDKVNWCFGYFILDDFREPRPDSKAEVLQYAEATIRVVDRVDRRFEMRTPEELKLPNGRYPKPSAEAMDDLQVLKRTMERLRDRVKAAPGDGPEVRSAVTDLAVDEEHAAVDRRMTDYFTKTCARD